MHRDDDRPLERRPARCGADAVEGLAVAAVVRDLARRFPRHRRHICADYGDVWIAVRVIDAEGATIAEEWVSR
jgi:hypothetical protein